MVNVRKYVPLFMEGFDRPVEQIESLDDIGKLSWAPGWAERSGFVRFYVHGNAVMVEGRKGNYCIGHIIGDEDD